MPGSNRLRLTDPRRGASAMEILVVLGVLLLGVMIFGQLFPGSLRIPTRHDDRAWANALAHEKTEHLQPLAWDHPALADGRHPEGEAVELVGVGGRWERWYVVETLAPPLERLKKVTVTVRWKHGIPDTVTATTYVKREGAAP